MCQKGREKEREERECGWVAARTRDAQLQLHSVVAKQPQHRFEGERASYDLLLVAWDMKTRKRKSQKPYEIEVRREWQAGRRPGDQ